MSRQDKLNPPKTDQVPRAEPLDDGRLPVELRLGLDEVAAAEEERLRSAQPRRPTRNDLTRLAAKIYDSRRARDRIFNEQLFGEPAWDMLLALYVLPKRGIPLSVSSLAHAANVPPTTGLRWEKVLCEQGLIKRGPHSKDRRSQLIALTDTGRLLMDRYFVRLHDIETCGAADTDRVLR